MTTNAASVARRFAVALDVEDYATAQALLADACVYLCRGQRYSGPAAIIAAYQCTGSSARDRFDSISYRSEVSAIDEAHARIRFADYVGSAGEEFVFECAQIVTVDDSGLIAAIDHIDFAGAREALADFMQRTAAR